MNLITLQNLIQVYIMNEQGGVTSSTQSDAVCPYPLTPSQRNTAHDPRHDETWAS